MLQLMMVSLNRMEVGQGGKVSALDEIHGEMVEGRAIVTMKRSQSISTTESMMAE